VFTVIETWNFSLPAANLYCTCTWCFQGKISLMHKARYDVVITIPLNIPVDTCILLVYSRAFNFTWFHCQHSTWGAKQNKNVTIWNLRSFHFFIRYLTFFHLFQAGNKITKEIFRVFWRKEGVKSKIVPFVTSRTFYDNCRNSRAFTSKFSLSITGQTHEFIIYAMRQRARADNLIIGHVRHINILTSIRGFRVKIANF